MTDTLVLGAGGRIGRLLRAGWPGRALWHARQGDWAWDMAQPFPGGVAAPVVLNLAGVTDARAPMEDNVTLAHAAWQAARAMGAQHLFLMSSAAVYGRAGAEEMAEERALTPVSPYGSAKARMEEAAMGWQGGPAITVLRLGNVAGADALLGRARQGVAVTLDPVAGQRGPLRSYIGPVSLAQVLARLCDIAVTGGAFPAVLNIAAAPPVAMGNLLDAAGLPWAYGPENPDVIPCVALATARLQALCSPPSATPASLVAEWRRAGASA